jgi:dihydropyrimidinase
MNQTKRGSLTKARYMSTVIKGGTVVTADLSYEADVLVEKNGVITEIGPGLKGDEVLDATGCYVMPGGIDPHVHLEMPFMGTYSSDDFESGTRAGARGRHDHGRRFLPAEPGRGAA